MCINEYNLLLTTYSDIYVYIILFKKSVFKWYPVNCGSLADSDISNYKCAPTNACLVPSFTYVILVWQLMG